MEKMVQNDVKCRKDHILSSLYSYKTAKKR